MRTEVAQKEKAESFCLECCRLQIMNLDYLRDEIRANMRRHRNYKSLFMAIFQPTFVLVFSILYQDRVSGFDDNSLLGLPNISCHPDTIEMRFRTKRPFTGKIYVQGHYANPDCRVDFSQAGADHDGRGGIRLHHGSCDMDRQRMPVVSGGHTGMQFSTVLVISFHPLFVTKTDRAFHINCMYKEENKNVDAGMTVEDVTPANILNDMPPPECKYTIRKDELNGEVLKFARVGDLIVHRWECDNEQYGMLVHSCYVEDGQGGRVEVIDARGCHKDSGVLGDPTYSEALNLAYRESYVFKFRDRIGVRFSCEIKLCMKAEDGCADITPPDCQGSSAEFSRDDPYSVTNKSLTAQNRIRRSLTSPTVSRTVDADLISQYVFVLDEPVEEDKEEGSESAKLRVRSGKDGTALIRGTHSSVCISSTLFAAICIVVLICFGLATVVVGHAICRKSAIKSLPSAHTSMYLPNSSVFSTPIPSIRTQLTSQRN